MALLATALTHSTTSVQPADTSASLRTTTRLLQAGSVAGPLFVVVALAQVLTRPGFDLTRHPVSLLSNGELGWIQIANFVLTGTLTVACAVGLRRALRGGPGGASAPLLLGVYGLGFIAAGLFTADPADGFPIGTPAGMPTAMTTQGVLHLVCGSLAFLALIAACFALARPFAASGQRSWAAGSRLAGAIFAVGLVEPMFGGPAGSLALFAGAAVAMLWVALAAARLSGNRTLDGR